MGKISKLAGDTVLYGLGNIIPRVLNFLLFPLHTRIFNPEDYGVVSFLYILVAFLHIVCTLGMETAYFRYATKGQHNAKRVFNIAQTAVVIVSLIFSVLLVIFSDLIAIHFSIPNQSYCIVWLAGILFIDAVSALPFSKLRLEKKPLHFAFGKIFNVLILLGFNLYFFVITNISNTGDTMFNLSELMRGKITTVQYGLEYIFFSNLIANGFYFLFFIKTFMAWRPTWDQTILPSMMKYALPIMIMSLSGCINELFSRWAIEWWLPPNFYPGKSSMYALGVFSVSYKYAIIMGLAIQAFRFAAEPFFFSNASNKKSPELFARVNHFFILVMSFIFLAVVINLDILKFIVGREEYYDSLGVVPTLLCGYFFLGMYYNFSVWFKLTDKTYYGTFITLGGMIITIILNFIFIPLWGYVGSSWVSPICYFFMTVVCYVIGQKYFPIPYKIMRSLGYLFFAFFLMVLSYQFTFNNQWITTSFHMGLLMVFVGVAYRIEIKKIKINNM